MNVLDAPWPEGRTVAITGASGGVGAACVRSFVAAGAYVADAEMMPGHALTARLRLEMD